MQEDVIINTCRFQYYTVLALSITILGLVLCAVLHSRKFKMCRGCLFSNAPNYQEDTPIVMDDLVQRPTPENKEEDQLEGEKREKEEQLQQHNETQDLEKEDVDAEDTETDVKYDDFNDY